MLTPEEKAGLAGMTPEQLLWLLGKIREGKAMFSVKGCMPQSAMDDLMKVVPDKLCHEIVQDLRQGRAEPSGFVPKVDRPLDEALKPEVEKAPEEPSYLKVERGWADPRPLESGSPSGERAINQMMDVQDRLDKVELANKLRRL